MLNQNKIRSALGHSEVIIGILVKPGSRKMIALRGLVDSCLTGTTIHPTVLKQINYRTKQGEESEWKMVAGMIRISKCLKIKKATLPRITVSQQFYFLQSLHIMPNTEQLYQIILDHDVIQAIKIDANVAEGIFWWQGSHQTNATTWPWD